jgi:protein-tyrosine phosphatase
MTDSLAGLPIDHVIDGVYIAGWRATLFTDPLRQAAITTVLKLYADTPHFPDDFTTLDHALPDGQFVPEAVLKRGASFVVEHVDAGRRVLVVCGAGISRSSTFVLAYMLERGHDLRAAYRLLRRQHPAAFPHLEMWRALITHYGLDYSPEAAFDWYTEDM